MPDLFGFQAGQRLAEQDRQQQQLAELSIRQGEQQLQKGNLDIKDSEIKLKNAELTLDRQAEMLKLLKSREQNSTASSGTPGSSKQETDLSDDLDFLAEISLQTGQPEEAAKYAKTASELRNNSSLIADREFQQRVKQLNFAVGALEGVNDEVSWKQANMLYSIEFGEESPFAQLEYSPEVVERLKNSVTTQRQKALIDADRKKAEAASTELRERESRIKLNDSRRKLTETREANLRKTGGTSALPKSEDLRAITDLMVKDYGDAALPEELRVTARPIAERMLDLMKDRTMTRSEAAAAAYNEAKEAGDLGGLRERRTLPGTRDKPLELPDKPKPEELKKNMYYLATKGRYAGQTLLWDGKNFKIPAAVEDDVLAESEEDEEETEDEEE